MERIVVIGNSGGGKSLLSRQLAEKLDLPYFEVDSILWQSGWRLVPEATYNAEHARLIAQERWLIDGLGTRRSIPARLARATGIVLIDMPLWIHFSLAAERQAHWGAGKLQHPPAAISEAPSIRALFRTIWDVNFEWMPEIRELVAQEKRRGKRTFELTTLEELDRFLSRTDL